MGLDCSHDAWHGAYSAFNSLRQVICRAVGGSYPPHAKYAFGSEIELDNNFIYFCKPGETASLRDGLMEFLTHSDCDGEIAPEMCLEVADALEEILPKIAQQTGTPWSGHVEQEGGYVAATEKFIAGCRRAAALNESLRFG